MAAIDVLSRPPTSSDLDGLADLLANVVHAGASVSFMLPFTVADARSWWHSTIARADPRAVILVARDDHGIAGTVQLVPAWPPNQPHRADIAKLLVHPRARRHGLGRALMAAIERHAHNAGFTLLTLDTARGDGAEFLYTNTGWQRVGVIPDYALYPDGRSCDTVVFYKRV